MSEVFKIGEFQLRNLIENRVKFLYLDLRKEDVREHELLAGSLKTSPEDVLAKVEQSGVGKDWPIVLICETGVTSMAAALKLAGDSYVNVCVVEGGLEALF